MFSRSTTILAAIISIAAIILTSQLKPEPPPLPYKEFTEELLAGREVVVKPPEITILLTGDIMLSRNVAQKIKNASDPLLPFRQVGELLKSSDLNFGNLESPFSNRSDITPSGGLVFNTPPDNVKGLQEYKFFVLNLANNHALDQGAAGLAFTKQHLAQHGIQTIGISTSTIEQAWEPVIYEIKSTKIGFVGASYASGNDGGKARNQYVARIEDQDLLKSQIFNLKSKVDLIIVSMHAGSEYTHKPNQTQIDFAHAAIEAGADVVVGHHPHWIQPVEIVKPKTPDPNRAEASGAGVVFYSLGNFIFDQEWSEKTKQGLIVRLKIQDKRLRSAELIPIVIESHCCPRLAVEEEAQNILSGIDATSTIHVLSK